MVRFLLRHSVTLSERPVAIFALGPTSLAEQEWREAREQLDRALAKIPCLVPVVVTVFGGVLDPTQLCFPFNQMLASDVRDWTDIRAFAEKLTTLAGM
jgi:menaquinone-dependent protoporphyrinogen IX oxidase